MKKNLSALFALFLCAGLYAQKASLAVKAGWSGSTLVVASTPFAAKNELYSKNFSPIQGFAAGVEGRLEFSRIFSGITGIQYTHKGYRGEAPMIDGSIQQTKVHLHYLSLPLAADARLFKGLSIQTGVEAGYLLAARTVLPDRTFDPEEFFDIYREFDAGLLLGLAYQFGDRFFVQTRGILGLIPVFDGEITDENGNAQPYEIYNRNIQVTAGYRF